MHFEQFEDNPFQLQISFYRIIELWEEQAATATGGRKQLAEEILRDIAPYPELRYGITSAEQVENNKELISRLLSDLFPAALTLNEIKVVTVPYREILINPTQRFQNILSAASPDFNMKIRDLDEHQFYVMSCCLILNEFYGTSFDLSRPLFYDIPTANGIIKHYRIMYNGDFIDLEPTESALKLTPEDVALLMDNYDDLALWKEKFPPGSWILKGFGIATMFDTTVENAVSTLKGTFLGARPGHKLKEQIETVFRSIYRIPDLHIGFTAYNHEESKFTAPAFNQQINSYLLFDQPERETYSVLCKSAFSNLIENKTYFAISDVNKYLDKDPEHDLALHFKAQNVQSFILAPAVKNNVLLGVFELVSYRPEELNSINANRLDIVIPFLTDTIDRQFIDLQNRIQAAIQNEYTTIHPSVYWKFRKEALKSIQHQVAGTEYALKEVTFQDVYPLYGQIDIKGSTDTRNRSLQLDMQRQLIAANRILDKLPYDDETEISGHINKIALLIEEVSLLKADTEQAVYHYLDTQVHPLFSRAAFLESAITPAINNYFLQCDKNEGEFHLNRRKYEATVKTINEKMALLLDKWQVEAQEQFPHYFERFKTDGVEHNMYIGASIVPNRQFEIKDLYNLRLSQLQILCAMERVQHIMKTKLPYPLEVTSLVLVFSSPISIRFRMDEKHFDVDGTYNARFEMVKKRIDKAFIKGSLERITAIGKLTIVYLSREEEREYLQYVRFMQSKQLLHEEIELLEVEDLQGVSGLKAMRIKIVYNTETPFGKRYQYSEMMDELSASEVG